MDTPDKTPAQLANKVIQQFADHLLGDSIIVEPHDYTALRVVYRRLGGSWVEFMRGHPNHVQLLMRVVTSWGVMPGRKRKTDA